MPSWSMISHEYDIDLRPLLQRCLAQTDAVPVLTEVAGGVRVACKGADAVKSMAFAAARVLCRDIQYFVLARMADALPLDLGEKQTVLTDALKAARAQEDIAPLEAALLQYLEGNRTLCVEGFMQFRMQRYLLLWQMCVEEAALAVLTQKEYRELMQVLNEYVGTRQPRIRELQLCIHADGSCTLTDDSEVRIEYVDCSTEGIVQLLVNMSPQRLIVYDLSGDQGNRLTETLQSVFSGRIRVFR